MRIKINNSIYSATEVKQVGYQTLYVHVYNHDNIVMIFNKAEDMKEAILSLYRQGFYVVEKEKVKQYYFEN